MRKAFKEAPETPDDEKCKDKGFLFYFWNQKQPKPISALHTKMKLCNHIISLYILHASLKTKNLLTLHHGTY